MGHKPQKDLIMSLKVSENKVKTKNKKVKQSVSKRKVDLRHYTLSFAKFIGTVIKSKKRIKSQPEDETNS